MATAGIFFVFFIVATAVHAADIYVDDRMSGPQITFRPIDAWKTYYPGPDRYAQTCTFANLTGASATFTFRGIGIQYMGYKDFGPVNATGILVVDLDDEIAIPISGNIDNAHPAQQILFARQGLEYGTHTITVRKVGLTPYSDFNVDAFIYRIPDTTTDTSSIIQSGTLPSATPSSNPGPTSSGNSSVGIIAGGIVGGIAAGAIIAFILWYFLLRRRQNTGPSEPGTIQYGASPWTAESERRLHYPVHGVQPPQGAPLLGLSLSPPSTQLHSGSTGLPSSTSHSTPGMSGPSGLQPTSLSSRSRQDSTSSFQHSSPVIRRPPSAAGTVFSSVTSPPPYVL